MGTPRKAGRGEGNGGGDKEGVSEKLAADGYTARQFEAFAALETRSSHSLTHRQTIVEESSKMATFPPACLPTPLLATHHPSEGSIAAAAASRCLARSWCSDSLTLTGRLTTPPTCAKQVPLQPQVSVETATLLRCATLGASVSDVVRAHSSTKSRPCLPIIRVKGAR